MVCNILGAWDDNITSIVIIIDYPYHQLYHNYGKQSNKSANDHSSMHHYMYIIIIIITIMIIMIIIIISI